MELTNRTLNTEIAPLFKTVATSFDIIFEKFQ
jgi:hypothetical protein